MASPTGLDNAVAARSRRVNRKHIDKQVTIRACENSMSHGCVLTGTVTSVSRRDFVIDDGDSAVTLLFSRDEWEIQS